MLSRGDERRGSSGAGRRSRAPCRSEVCMYGREHTCGKESLFLCDTRRRDDPLATASQTQEKQLVLRRRCAAAAQSGVKLPTSY
jgi:hypothetical protein